MWLVRSHKSVQQDQTCCWSFMWLIGCQNCDLLVLVSIKEIPHLSHAKMIAASAFMAYAYIFDKKHWLCIDIFCYVYACVSLALSMRWWLHFFCWLLGCSGNGCNDQGWQGLFVSPFKVWGFFLQSVLHQLKTIPHLAPLLGANEASGDSMVAGHYHTCCCWRLLNRCVTVTVVQTAP